MAKDRITQGRAGEAQALVGEAITAMDQIHVILRDLTGFARDVPRGVIDLAALVNGALRISSYETDRRARVKREFDDGVVAFVRGPRVAQVILNLLLNAAQAIPSGNPDGNIIDVRLRYGDGRVLIEVGDTGRGVAEDIAERIFEPFFTTRGARGGTGLGLWLSRAIVEEEGGSLTWYNRPEGGAVFTVSLPMCEAERPARFASGAPAWK